MISTVSDNELVKACRVLFSPEGNICSVDFIKNLSSSALKKAYRKKAFETHPDIVSGNNDGVILQSEQFIRVKLAYEVLMPLASGGESAGKKFRGQVFYKGPVPLHTLRIGQFMYYSGDITWKTLTDAIRWQRKKRIPYGKIAEDWGILSPEEIKIILNRREKGEKFGDCARRLGFLTLFQHRAVMEKQKKHHRRFGDFFISKGFFSVRQMENMARRQLSHNKAIESSRF